MKIFVTRQISSAGPELLKAKGYEVDVSMKDAPLTSEELFAILATKPYDAILCDIDDKIGADVLTAAGPQLKIVANFAVGYDNINVKELAERGVYATNTPGVLTNAVAEHAFALILSIARRIVEADHFMRSGQYHNWGPMLLLGSDISGKTLGVVGLGRIGSRVAYYGAKGFDMHVLYYDPKRNEEFEKETGARYTPNLDDLLKESDFVSVHVPLLPTTKHLIDASKLKLMKKSAYLVNTSRGPILDEKALAVALQAGIIKGAAIDVFEHEPEMEPLLKNLPNVIVTPHIASATEETRQKMSELAAQNIIAALEGGVPPNLVR